MTTATKKLNDAQRDALAAVAAECRRQTSYGNAARCVGSPKGVLVNTLDSLRRAGLVEREYSRLGGRGPISTRFSWSLTPTATQTEAK